MLIYLLDSAVHPLIYAYVFQETDLFRNAEAIAMIQELALHGVVLLDFKIE
jgi:hypothetical protein